jgi:hypothetical protein
MKGCARDDFPNRGPGLGTGPRDQQTVAASHQAFGNQGNLRRGFALSEYNLRHALPHGSMVVDTGEVEVFIRGVPQGRNDLGKRLIMWDRSLLYVSEEQAELRLIHSVFGPIAADRGGTPLKSSTFAG